MQRLLLCVLLCASAFARDSYCPPSILVKQSIEDTPPGWTAEHNDIGSQLSGVTFYSGPPSEQASLVYDKWTRRNGLAYALWHFQAGSPHHIWLSCSYANTTITLAKELPGETSQCTITYEPKTEIAGLPSIREISCK